MQDIWTIQKILSWTQEYFNKHRVPESRLSAELLLAHLLKIKRLDLYLQFERILTPDELNQYRGYIQRRVKFEPVQYITGQQDFMGLSFKVTSDTLIPRPETELLVENTLKDLEKLTIDEPRVLDVGTGCGAIAISIAYFCKSCHVTALDFSEKALQVARENAEKMDLQNINFIHGDGNLLHPNENERYHLVVSNPPYISEKDYQVLHPQVKDYEPREALLAGPEGTEFYEQFIATLHHILHSKGLVLLEVGYDQLKKVKEIFKKQGFTNFQSISDYQNIPRIIRVKK
jgi:release factor glutamine methyltransferase